MDIQDPWQRYFSGTDIRDKMVQCIPIENRAILERTTAVSLYVGITLCYMYTEFVKSVSLNVFTSLLVRGKMALNNFRNDSWMTYIKKWWEYKIW